MAYVQKSSKSTSVSVPYYKSTYISSGGPNPGSSDDSSPQQIPQLSRKFVARRISEGETGRLKEELKCQACGKGYKHVSSLAKHLWEHTPEWNVTSKLLISKHQQVQLLEAASILVSMNEEDEADSTDELAFNKQQMGAIAASAPTYTRQLSSTPGALDIPGSSEGSSPSPPPAVSTPPNVPISSSTRPISKPSYYTRRSSLSAFPPSSAARRGSTPSVNLASSPSLVSRLSKSPITDSLYADSNIGSLSSSVKLIDEYEMLASPFKSRRMSNLRRSRGDLFGDSEEGPSPPDESPGVFGEMDE
jgi:hypothetical protein